MAILGGRIGLVPMLRAPSMVSPQVVAVAPLVQAHTISPVVVERASAISADPIRSVVPSNLDKGTSLLLARARDVAISANVAALPNPLAVARRISPPTHAGPSPAVTTSSNAGVSLGPAPSGGATVSGQPVDWQSGAFLSKPEEAWREAWSAGSETSLEDAGEVQEFSADALPVTTATPKRFPIVPVAIVGLVALALLLWNRR